ncbi:MAG: hypothetical protein ABJP52_10340, partial [Flavobacteriaceae bacterium]
AAYNTPRSPLWAIPLPTSIMHRLLAYHPFWYDSTTLNGRARSLRRNAIRRPNRSPEGTSHGASCRKALELF